MSRGVPSEHQQIGPPKDGVMDEKKSTELVPVNETRAELPPILAGRHTAAVEAQVRKLLRLRRRHLRALGHPAARACTRSGPTART